MPIQELDPEIVRKLLEGFDNELEPEQLKLEALYRQVVCPRCGNGSWQKEFASGHIFADPDCLVPRALLRCSQCRCLYNPHRLDPAGRPMVVEVGSR